LEAIGISRSEDELIALCKTTPDGTEWLNLVRALRTIEGVRGLPFDDTHRDVALLRLYAALQDGRSVLVCVDAWKHFAVAVGVLGKTVVCVDSDDNDLIRYRTPEEFADWWEGPEGARKRYCGIIL
jgi:hypothetical protein